ncbi:zinc_ribbon_12 domain-containing protein [Psidium guajava]|nr:zinc_ribbon_12 domain-containing protein [Psidium guajava]
MMAQRSKLRLVHCPECANLLEELHGCSVFRCGACGAVLKAKKREPTSDGGNSGETSNSFGDAREHESESNDRNVKNERLLSSGVRADGSISTSAMQNREESARTRSDNVRDKSTGSRFDRRRAKEETVYAFDYMQNAEDRANKFVERGFGENSWAERRRSSFTRDHFEGFLRDSRIVTDHKMTRRYSYPKEGPSDYYGSPTFGYGEFLGSRDDGTDRDRVRELERERAKLLRKLDELANQINQSSDMANNPGAGETVLRHQRIASGDPSYAHAGCDIMDEPLNREGPIRKPPDAKQDCESIRSMASYEMEMLNLYFSPWDCQLNLLEKPRRSFGPGTTRPFCRYAHELPHGHLAEGYLGFGRDLPVMYPNQSPHHHPSCACSSCYYKYERVPTPQFLPNASSSSKTFEDPLNSNLYHRVNAVKIRPQHTAQSGDSTSSSNSKYLHPLQIRLGDPDLEMENLFLSPPKRSMVSHQNKKHCHPIAGAAPFIMCLNCLELLKLPKELIVKEKCDQQKIRCGWCSAIILFEIKNKKLVTSIEGSSGGAAKDGGDIQISSTCSGSGGFNADTCLSGTRTSSDPYDGSSKLKLTRESSLLEVQPHNTSNYGKKQGLHSPASSLPAFPSEGEESPDSVIAHCNVRSEYNTSPKPENSRVPEHFDNSLTNGNENNRMNQEGVSLEKNNTCRSTRDDASTPTELEVPLNEYPNAGQSLLEVKPQNASDSGKMQGLHSPASSSPSFRSEEERPDSVIAHINVLTRSENNTSPKPQNSHVPRHFDNSSSYENEKRRMNQEGVPLQNGACQSTSNDVSAMAEVEVPLNEDPHTGLSQDSTDASKEAKEKVKKRSKSFLAGLKKSNGEFQNLENENPEVTVNGHLIPDDNVKRAEKLAGPVLPGDYWYDFQAGFWGIMNQPCLGIIPPFIEEFNHPMPANCAAGNTGIFINRRELNQRDLDLLASRGLPRTRNRFYAIDISGIVLDEKTREVLYNLGKLAPTVERVQRGFGMRVPEVE